MKYLNFTLQEKDRPDIEPQVEEDLDLWEMLNAFIFGEQDDDDDNENENSKSSSTADRDTNGHTYKATKRKLLSVEEDINVDDSSHVHHGHSHSHDSKAQGFKKTVEDATERDAKVEVVQEEAETTSQGKQEKSSNIFSNIFNVVMKIIDDTLLHW